MQSGGSMAPDILTLTEFSPNGTENSMNLGNQINQRSMNWGQLEGLVSHVCLAGAVVASWSLTQEVTGSSAFNDKYFCH